MTNDLDLHRMLGERAAEVSEPAGLAAGARRRAQQIRTRRRVGAAAAFAAGLALLAPTAPAAITALNGGSEPRPPEIAGTPTQDERTAPSPSPEPEPTRHQVTVAPVDLAQGESPGTGWMQGTTFFHPSGGRIDVPAGLNRPVAYGEDQVAGHEPATGEVWFSTGDRIPGHGPVLSPDGSRLSWYFDEGTVTGLTSVPVGQDASSDNSRVYDVPAGERLEPVGFLGSDVIVSNRVGEDGTLLGARRDGPGTTTATDAWSVEQVSGVSGNSGLVAGRTSTSDDLSTCWGVFPAEGGGALWETCDYGLEQFSPSGQLLLAGPSVRSGPGVRTLAVLDARSGDPVLTVEGAGSTIVTDWAFETESQILFTAWQSGQWSIVRCDLEGACERATDLAAGDDVEPQFRLARLP